MRCADILRTAYLFICPMGIYSSFLKIAQVKTKSSAHKILLADMHEGTRIVEDDRIKVK